MQRGVTPSELKEGVGDTCPTTWSLSDSSLDEIQVLSVDPGSDEPALPPMWTGAVDRLVR